MNPNADRSQERTCSRGRRRQSRKGDLSLARRRLSEVFQRLGYGTVWNLPVEGGEPVLGRQLRMTRRLKFPGNNGACEKAELKDYVIKEELVSFFELLDRLGDGIVDEIEVTQGLPQRGSMTETIRL